MTRSTAIGFIPIIVIALLLGVYLSQTLAGNSTTSQEKSTQTAVTNTSTTVVENSFTVTSFSSSIAMHKLVFNQSGICTPAIYVTPWAVTLQSSITIIEPSGSNLSLISGPSSSLNLLASNKIYSTIVFTVPDGNYNFSILPNDFFPSNGAVTVSGHDVGVQLNIQLFVEGCGS